MLCVDLGESFSTHFFLQNTYEQNFASIQPRSSPAKFACSPRAQIPQVTVIVPHVYNTGALWRLIVPQGVILPTDGDMFASYTSVTDYVFFLTPG